MGPEIPVGCTPLPIKVESFGAERSGIQNLIWAELITEPGSIEIGVQRSSDLLSWETIEFMEMYSEEIEEVDILTTDPDPTPLSYYRLLLTENGRAFYSRVIFLENLIEHQVELFPIPATEKVTISGISGKGTRIVVRSQQGQIMMEESIEFGQNTLDISALPKGVYLLDIRNSDIQQTKKLIIY